MNSVKTSFISLTLFLAVLLCFLSAVSFAQDSTDGNEGKADENGLILEIIPGETFTAYMLIVQDPTRVIQGCRPDRIGSKGYVLSDFVSYYDGVAGINAGGFDDPDGMGDGSTPEHLIVHDGELICGYMGVGNGFVGIDADGILRTDFTSVGEVENAHILEGAGFGPVLVRDGKATEESGKDSGLNPRTAIGQRYDGAILLLVIDGRQANSLGGTYADEAELMLQFGAVTACNLDGGSSSLLWYNGEYINNKSHSVGVRNMPSSFVVLKEGTHESTEKFQKYFDDLSMLYNSSADSLNVTESKSNTASESDPEAKLKAEENQQINLPVEEQQEISDFALNYTQKYVDFSADVGMNSSGNWNSLKAFLIPDSRLYRRLYGAFGSFGYALTYECQIVESTVTKCCGSGKNTYTVEINYCTKTTGRSSDTALEERNLRLGVVRQGGALYVDSMTFF